MRARVLSMHYGEVQENSSFADRLAVWIRACPSGEEAVYRRVERPRVRLKKCPGCRKLLTREHIFTRGMLFCLALAVLVFPGIARAGAAAVVISEIAAFEKSDHEWVEIVNRSSAPVDLASWKFTESGGNHGVALFRGADSVLMAGEYAIIADVAANFAVDYPDYGGRIFDSSWDSLKEEGELIALKDVTGDVIESFAYLSAPNASLERIDVAADEYESGNWKERASGASPGEAYSPAIADAAAPVAALMQPEISPPSAPLVIPGPPPRPRVIISELFPNPAGSDAAEWIEITNTGIASALLKGWTLTDHETAYVFDDRTLPFNGFIVLPRAVTNIALDNDGDEVVLTDVTGREIARAAYDEFVEESVAIVRAEDGTMALSASSTPGVGNVITPPNRPPLVVVDAPREVDAGRLVLLDASDTFDPDGDALSFRYAFDDGTEARFERTLHAFRSGRHLVTLTVADAAGHEVVSKISIRAQGQETVTASAGNGAELPKLRVSRAQNTRRVSSSLRVTGTVTAVPGAMNRRTFLILGDNGPVEIYQNNASFPELEVGNVVSVLGRKSGRKGLLRILVDKADDVEVVSVGEPPEPEVLPVADILGVADGTLVAARGTVLDKSGNSATLADASGDELVVSKPVNGWPSGLLSGSVISVRAILRKTSQGPRLLPRESGDIEVESVPKTDAVVTPVRSEPGPFAGVLPAAGALALALGGRSAVRRFRNRKQPPQSIITHLEPAETYGTKTPTYRVSFDHADG